MKMIILKCAVFIFLVFITQDSVTQIKGPVQPDYLGFTPIQGDDLVDPYSGQFNYSIPVVTIPGPDGSGYTMTLGYSSNNRPDDEASWVGYGWNLSPGAINRNKRGFPDEFNEVEVIYYRKRLPNKSISQVPNVGLEIFSNAKPSDDPNSNPLGSLNASVAYMYNNQTGFRRTYSIGGGASGIFNANLNKSSDGSFGIGVTPTIIYSWANDMLFGELNKDDPNNLWSKAFLTLESYNSFTSPLMSYRGEMPMITEEYSGSSNTFIPALRTSLIPLIGLNASYSYTESTIEYPKNPIKKNAFGYLYSDSPKFEAGSVMDYFTVNERGIKESDRFLPIPFSNVDDFSVSGNGIVGSFRAWADRPEVYRPNRVDTETTNNIYGASVTIGSVWGGGVNFGDGNDWKSIKEWHNSSENAEYEHVFRFRNDRGGSLDYYAGDYENLFEPIPIKSDYYNADKVRENIFMNPVEMTKMSKKIDPTYFGNIKAGEALNIPENIPEISGLRREMIVGYRITSENGTVYEYHQPVFNRNETNLSYGIDQLSKSSETNFTHDGKIAYIQNVHPENPIESGIDVIMGQKVEEAFASSYLLTAIYSPDYVDLGDEGPSHEDLGTWTKFTYEMTAGSPDKSDNLENWYKWRMPYNGLYYDRGELSNKYDDRGSVNYGYKELYYLSTVETKSHKAFFVNNKSDFSVQRSVNGITETNNITARKQVIDHNSGTAEFIERLDAYPAHNSEDEASGSKDAVSWKNQISDTVVLPAKNPSRFLERIELYSKKPGSENTI
jgi:hypothetical protein